MKRNIIRINEKKCTGCGSCVSDCPEGALQLVNGKAMVTNDLFCDGLGACIGDCPEGAIEVETREAVPYDERKVIENIARAGSPAIAAHLRHLKEHGQRRLLHEAVAFLRENRLDVPDYEGPLTLQCGSSVSRSTRISNGHTPESDESTSQLKNWPIQLRLLNPRTPVLKKAALLVAADCVPFSYVNFHERFLKDRTLIIFCPKLDTATEEYVDKLIEIFVHHDITSVSLVHMEVPCCSGIKVIVQEALERAQKDITVEEHTISITGDIIEPLR